MHFSITFWNRNDDILLIYSLSHCLSPFGTDIAEYQMLGNYKHKKCISHCFGDWEVQGLGASRVSVWCRSAFWLIDRSLLTVALPGGRSKETLWGLFYKGTNPIHEGSTLIISSPKDPISKIPIHWCGVRFQHRNMTERIDLVHRSHQTLCTYVPTQCQGWNTSPVLGLCPSQAAEFAAALAVFREPTSSSPILFFNHSSSLYVSLPIKVSLE